MEGYRFIKVSEGEHVARMTLARPPVNVLNIAMLTEMNRFLQSLIERRELCALLIDGEGKVFSAGVDVPEHKKGTIDSMIGTLHETFRLMHQLPMPTVCAAHGGAYGGGMELAIFCDIVLGADDLKMGVPEITLGVFPPLAVAHLAGIIGVNRAAELIYTGSVIGATEAMRLGLVNHVYPASDFRGEVDRFVAKLGGMSAFALRQAKAAFKRVTARSFVADLKDAESIYLNDLMTGHDPTEGLTAFIEKRSPSWEHR